MARRAQRPNPKQGADGRWHAWVTVGRKLNGRPEQVHVDRATWEECDDEIDRLWANVKKGIRPEPGAKMPLPDWIDEYIDKVLPRRRKKPVTPDTLYRYRSWAKNWIRPMCRVPLGRLRGHHLEALYGELGDAGLSSSTQRSAHYLIQGALEVAFKRGYCERNEAKTIDAPEEDPPPIEIFTVMEARAILRELEDHPRQARFVIALTLGTRQGETLGLRWGHVDPHQIRIEWQLGRRVYRHGCGGRCTRKRAVDCPKASLPLKAGEVQLRGGLILKPPKAGSRRAIPLPEEVAGILGEHRKRWAAQKLAAGSWASHDLVFCTEFGEPLDPKADGEEWRALLVSAGVDHRRLHDARHTAATMIHAVSELGVAQEVLGHTTPEMTQRYVHMAEELKASEAAKTATQSSVRKLFG